MLVIKHLFSFTYIIFSLVTIQVLVIIELKSVDYDHVNHDRSDAFMKHLMERNVNCK